MFILKKQFKFEASHQLKNHDGKCSRLHGHSWIVDVRVNGTRLESSGPKENMLMDFGDMSDIGKKVIVERYDHYHLNDVLNSAMPTSELLAKIIYDEFKMELDSREVGNAWIDSVTVHETCTSETYYDEKPR